MVRQRNAVVFLHPEDADRQPSDGACNPIAVGVERRLVRRANIADHVHFHSVDDGMEILAPEPEIAHRSGQGLRAGDWPARIESIDVGAPAFELLLAFTTGTARIGDVVHLPAE